MNTDKFPTERHKDEPVDWNAAVGLVTAGQYDPIITILQQAIAANQGGGKLILTQTLDLAQHAGFLCRQFQAETARYQKEYELAYQREQEIRQQFLALIDLARQNSPSIPPPKEEPQTKPIPNAADLSTCEKRPGWLARIRNYFQPRPVAPFAEQAEVAPGYPFIPPDRIPLATVAPPDDRSENSNMIPVEALSVADSSVAEKPDALLPVEGPEPAEAGSPSLVVYCLGPFRVYQDEQPVENWPSSKGKAVFKYLVTHHDRPVIKDILMELFWPDTPAEAARNNLNVAIYGLRQALRKTHPAFSHVLFTEDCYRLNPDIRIWLDYEAFQRTLAEARTLEAGGDLEGALSEYCKAEALYQGEFLEEDRYEGWPATLREQLQEEYLSLLDRLNDYSSDKKDYQTCITVSRKMLAIEPCSEEAYRRLMRSYFERGQTHMALRQYHQCVEALKAELNVAPSSATKELYEYIRRNLLD